MDDTFGMTKMDDTFGMTKMDDTFGNEQAFTFEEVEKSIMEEVAFNFELEPTATFFVHFEIVPANHTSRIERKFKVNAMTYKNIFNKILLNVKKIIEEIFYFQPSVDTVYFIFRFESYDSSNEITKRYEINR